jgi:hypothetical protein
VSAEKRGTLSLYDTPDDIAAASYARIARAGVNSVVVLVSAVLVQGIAVRPVGERRAFMTNRRGQDFADRSVNLPPLSRANLATLPLGMNAGKVQDFRRVKIANAGRGALIEEGHFDRATTLTKAFR